MHREPSHLNRADRMPKRYVPPGTRAYMDDGEGKPEYCSGNLDPVSKTASASEASVWSVPDRQSRRPRILDVYIVPIIVKTLVEIRSHDLRASASQQRCYAT